MSAIILTLFLALSTWAQEPGEPNAPESNPDEAIQEPGAEALEPLSDGESRLISLDELPEVPAGNEVTVLFVFERAEAVSASSSVSRSFVNARTIRVQPDARSNAVFVSGRADLVREAIARMKALDEATPEAPPRPVRQKPGPAEGPMAVIEDYGADASQATSRVGFLIAGLVGLAVVGILLARRVVG